MTEVHDYSLLGEDGQQAVESGLANAEWYRTPVPRARMKELMQRRDGPALRDSLLWLGLLVLFAVLAIWTWFSWIAVLALLCYGVLYGSASDARWHEHGHGTAFKTQWMNDVMYQIACFMIMRDPTVWRWSHTRHHTDTIIVGRDPEILAMRPPALGHIAGNFVGLFDVPRALRDMVVHSLGRLGAQEATFIPDSERHKVARTARIWMLVYAGLIVVTIATRSILPLLLIGPLPRMYGAWHHLLTGLTQHSGLAEDVLDHRLNSRTMTLNPISRFIYLNMNFHIEHHMFPMVPYYSLPQLHEEIKHDCPAPCHGFYGAFKEFLPVLLRQRKDPTVFIDRTLPGSSGSPAVA